MLAFVVRETIGCLLPSEAVGVVSQFAAGQLCHAYLKEVYDSLLQSKHKDYLEKWCTGTCKAIHPPSQYLGHSMRTHVHSGEAISDVEIVLGGVALDATSHRDYHLGRLADLDRYLVANGAELYLCPVEFESERRTLGMLTLLDMGEKGDLQAAVEKMGRQAVRFRRPDFKGESDEFWDGQESSLTEAVKRAVDRADSVQLRAYLDSVNRPLAALRRARRHRVVRDAYGQYVRRGYDLLGLYLVALDEILARQTGLNYQARQTSSMGRTLLKSTWDETARILRDVDYHTMALFTWLAPQMYAAIQEAGDKAGPLRKTRAEFGGFYEFAEGWLEDSRPENSEDVDQMRLVLYEGLTKWLLTAIDKKDTELIERLCGAGRGLVFGRSEELTFSRCDLVARHFVLAGYLMSQAKGGGVNAAAIGRMFCEEYSHGPKVSFENLLAFYRGNGASLQTLEPYLRIFYKPVRTTTDVLTGSSNSSGFGMTGVHEMALAFIYLAARALTDSPSKPEPIPEGFSFSINDAAIQTVADLFKGTGLDHGLKQLKSWRDQSQQLHEEADAKAIAEAPLIPEKMKEWEGEFWEAYPASSPVLSLCLRNGNYVISKAECREDLRYLLPKTAVIEWRIPIIGAGGKEYGRSVGCYMEGQMLDRLTSNAGTASQVQGGLSAAMDRAVGWLKNRGCGRERGMIVVTTRHAPESVLYDDKDFVPSWQEDVHALGLDGFYQGFPVVWRRKHEEEEHGDDTTNAAVRECVVVADLRGWQGIEVRPSVIRDTKLGELVIRQWTDKEIRDALHSKKLEAKDVDRAKGNCPVDIALYWTLSSTEPPQAQSFQIKPDPTSGEA
jgi:hypothetical protein